MNYHNITYPDMLNGDGLRVVLWLSGCSHHCKGCQNPQTWNSISGIEFDEYAKKELFEALDNDYISGVTLSGGDPLYEKNLDEVLELILEVRKKFPNKTIWLYTGYDFNFIMHWTQEQYEIDVHNNFRIDHTDYLRQQIVSYCDVVVDGKYIEELRDVSLHWRGSSNQRVIDVQQSLKKGEIVLWSN